MTDQHIPRQDPAGAKFSSYSVSGPIEPLFDASAEVIDQDFVVTNSGGATLSLKELDVVNITDAGVITKAVVASGAGNANAIMAMPIDIPAGASVSVAIHTSGHWNTRALGYDASFTTDVLKQNAFLAGNRPMIRASTPKFSNDAIDIPN